MESSGPWWISNPVMEEANFVHDQYDSGSLDQFMTTESIWQDIEHPLSSGSHSSYSCYDPPVRIASKTLSSSSVENVQAEKPKKVPRTVSWSSDGGTKVKPMPASTPSILCFGKEDSPSCDDYELYQLHLAGAVKSKGDKGVTNSGGAKRNNETMATQGARPPSHNQEHVIAERNRREKLSQRFIALSAMLPDLKKMDKASVLGDAIKHMKQLQEKVNQLEDQAAKRKPEPVVIVKKPQLLSATDDDISSCDENFEDRPPFDKRLPEIEARLLEKTVLIKIHCENIKGVLVKALSEIENLNLMVISSNVIPFAGFLHITLMAQIEEGFSMTGKDLVKTLNLALRQ